MEREAQASKMIRRRKNVAIPGDDTALPTEGRSPLWRRLARQTALGAAGALGSGLVTWLLVWLQRQ